MGTFFGGLAEVNGRVTSYGTDYGHIDGLESDYKIAPIQIYESVAKIYDAPNQQDVSGSVINRFPENVFGIGDYTYLTKPLINIDINGGRGGQEG